MKINWKDHLVNLIVVILGISIAFWLNNWAENSKSKKQESIYLRSLINDLNDDLEELGLLQTYNKNQITKIGRLTSFAIGQKVPEDSLMTDIFTIQYNLPFTPQNVTYQSMTSSGKMDLIQDFQLKNQMLELYNQYYGGMALWDETANSHLDNFIRPIVIKHLEVQGRNKINTDMIKMQEFRNALFSQQFILQQRQGFMRNMQAATDSLKTNIETYLEE